MFLPANIFLSAIFECKNKLITVVNIQLFPNEFQEKYNLRRSAKQISDSPEHLIEK